MNKEILEPVLNQELYARSPAKLVNDRLNWFSDKYKEKLNRGRRFATMQLALNLFLEKCRSAGPGVLIETGCQRQEDDWGAGCSTTIFVDFLRHHENETRFISIDINSANIERARIEAAETHLQPRPKFILGDSVEELGRLDSQPIHLLYLDSYDYPDGEVIENFRLEGETYLDTLRRLNQIPNSLLREEYPDLTELIHPCQQHQLQELKAIDLDSLHPIILLDDYDLPGGGKCYLSHRFLANSGYTCLLADYQSVWIRKGMLTL